LNGLAPTYADLPFNRRKFVQFCLVADCAELPTWPMFPVRLSTLIRYAWWLQFHGVKGGMHSIRNYVSAVTEWAQACGHPDPRLSEPWVYRRFRLEAPKHLQVVEGSRAKFAIKAPHLKVMAEHAVVSDLEDLEDLTAYSLAFFTTARIGHFYQQSGQRNHTKHLARFEDIKFEPSFEEPERVVLLMPGGKTRCLAKKDPWWTAVGRCSYAKLCPVRLLKLWYLRVFSGDSKQYLFARAAGALPRMRQSFTRRLRGRMAYVGPALGYSGDEFDVTKWSGISFRKGGLSALAPFVQPHELAQHADHASVETTRKYYLSQTIENRAANTALMTRTMFPGESWAAGVQTESVWAADIVDGEANAGPVWQRFRAP